MTTILIHIKKELPIMVVPVSFLCLDYLFGFGISVHSGSIQTRFSSTAIS
uniref:Uncharacterized protein n=1 Tax=uncultured marine virus TaxID=186617 RepID=A0A0F7L8T0_9VIRU|nr:hypothetical protein [uncultured marine virus]